MTAVYKWEVMKLLAQERTYLGLGAAMVIPLAFVIVLNIQQGGPNDIPLGRYIRQTGLATPFVVLFFMSIWAFPLITALVAGDIVAAESHNGTLKTILTRSRDRGQIFAGKVAAAFTYAVVAVFAMGLVAVVAASIAWGLHPLTSLSGTTVSTGHGIGLLAATLLGELVRRDVLPGAGGLLVTPVGDRDPDVLAGRLHAEIARLTRGEFGHGLGRPRVTRRVLRRADRREDHRRVGRLGRLGERGVGHVPSFAGRVEEVISPRPDGRGRP